MNRLCKGEYFKPDALKENIITFLKLLIVVLHFTLIILILYPQNLNLLFVTLGVVSRIFTVDKAANKVAFV